MTIEHSQEIAAPIRTVWGLTVDVAAWVEINPNVVGAECLDETELRAGSRVRIRQRGLRPKVWTVVVHDPPHRFSWTTRLLWLTMTATHELEATESGTRNTLRLELTGPGAGGVGRLLKGPLEAALAAENDGFKRAAETDTPSSSGPPRG